MDNRLPKKDHEYDFEDYLDYKNNPRKYRGVNHPFNSPPWREKSRLTFRKGCASAAMGILILFLTGVSYWELIIRQEDSTLVIPLIAMSLFGLIVLYGGISTMIQAPPADE